MTVQELLDLLVDLDSPDDLRERLRAAIDGYRERYPNSWSHMPTFTRDLLDSAGRAATKEGRL